MSVLSEHRTIAYAIVRREPAPRRRFRVIGYWPTYTEAHRRVRHLPRGGGYSYHVRRRTIIYQTEAIVLF